jgi:hypothetical protein
MDRRENEQVREQRYRQPAQKLAVAVIRNADLEREHDDGQAYRQDARGKRDDQVGGRTHRGDVGRDVERVGEHDERDREGEHRTRKALA